MANEAQNIINDLEDLTRSGHRQTALERLNKYTKSHRIPRQYLAQFAQIASRNNAHLTALKILSKEVSRMQETNQPTLNSIINVYARALQFIGSAQEAKKILRFGDPTPEKDLTEVFILFSEWRYKESLPLLRRYLKSSEISSYQRLIGQVNLMAAYASLGMAVEAKRLFLNIEIEFEQHPTAQILRGNSFEIMAQVHMDQNDLEMARKSLRKAREFLEPHGDRYLLFIEKWEAILIGKEDPAEGMLKLIQVREKAVHLKNLETIRDCDLHIARLSGSRLAVQRVLMATPILSYRKKIIKEYKLEFHEDRFFSCRVDDILAEPSGSAIHLDDFILKMNPLSQKLIQIVLNDLYKSPRMGALFSFLHPEEYFNPSTSPQRVRNSVKRLNKTLELFQVDLRFHFVEGGLRVSSSPGRVIRFPSRIGRLEDHDFLLMAIRSRFQGKSFSRNELLTQLQINSFRINRNLKVLRKEGKILSLKDGRTKRYICNRFLATS